MSRWMHVTGVLQPVSHHQSGLLQQCRHVSLPLRGDLVLLQQAINADKHIDHSLNHSQPA